jgi:transcriptional regulator with XRE-family HTH domain
MNIMNHISKSLGQRIKNYRIQAKFSQEELSSMIGISRTSLSQIENGSRKICAEELKAFSEVFHVPVDYLFNHDKEPSVIIDISVKKEEKPQIRISVPQVKLEKFKEVLLYILNKAGSRPNVGETVIYKLLYFSDFDFYEKYEEQLIGASYLKNEFGPTPCEFKKIVEIMIEDDEIEEITTSYHGYSQKKYLPLREADLSKLMAHEADMIDKVLSKLAEKNASQISDYSHGDVPWLVTPDGELIDYESVFYRTTPYSVRQYEQDI